MSQHWPDQTDLRGMMQVILASVENGKTPLVVDAHNRRYACLLSDNRNALVEDPRANLETSAGLILVSSL